MHMKNGPVSVCKYLPPHDAGRIALSRLAATIHAANEVSPARWGLSVLPKMLRVNLGKIEVFTVDTESVRLLVDYSELQNAAPKWKGRFLYYAEPEPEAGYYASVAGSVICVIDTSACPDLVDCLADLEQAHLRLLRRAGLTTPNPMTQKSHSITAVLQIADLLGSPVPQPAYAVL